MEPFVALDRARAEWEGRLDAVAPEQWDLPTPCGDWTVRALVQHLVAGNRMTGLLLAGNGRDEAVAQLREWHVVDPASPPREVIAAFAASADAQADAVRQPGALERTCHHPVGDVPGAQLLGFRIGDLTLHSWDLARAIGADEQIDPELVEEVYGSLAPMAPFIGTIGVFGTGPSGAVDDTAPTQRRLLDLSGRRP